MSESICGLRRGNIQKINCYDPATFDKLCPEPPQPQRRFGTAAQSRISNDTQGKSQCATKDADLPRVNKSAIVSPSEQRYVRSKMETRRRMAQFPATYADRSCHANSCSRRQLRDLATRQLVPRRLSNARLNVGPAGSFATADSRVSAHSERERCRFPSLRENVNPVRKIP